jgi:hypothetical protein
MTDDQSHVDVTTTPENDAASVDALDEYIAEQMLNPAFAQWWHWACARMPNKLPVDGHEYHRRQRNRVKRRRQ